MADEGRYDLLALKYETTSKSKAINEEKTPAGIVVCVSVAASRLERMAIATCKRTIERAPAYKFAGETRFVVADLRRR